ncbi:MAG: cytochrome c biogenesis protein ResB [Bacteroidaceae bacterium]|nr:cytochrome c biogenesis protein ResB [Bacteroidaceae bacterium]
MGTGIMQMLSQRYRQLIGRCALLLVAGMALQFLWGNVNPSFLTYPWSLVLVVNYLYFLVLLYAKQDAWKFVRGLYDRPAYIVSLSAMLVLTLFFGMIRQDGSAEGLWGWMGFTSMSSSWVFVLFLVHFMSILGLKAIDDVHHLKQRRWSMVLMHASVFVILVSATLGSGDKARVRIMAHQGHPVSVAIAENGTIMELPFTLMLKEFSLEGDSLRFHYLSEVIITDDDGEREAEIRVNHPLRVGQWWIYQSGYDNSYGSRTVISILECVKDGWYPAVHIAMWTILVGGAMMFVGAFKKKKE